MIENGGFLRKLMFLKYKMSESIFIIAENIFLTIEKFLVKRKNFLPDFPHARTQQELFSNA